MPAAATPAAATVSTRLTTLSDVERLHAMIHTAYRSEKNWTNESALVQGERITVPELREQIQTQLDPVLVAEIDGQVAGCIQLEFCRDHPSYELPDDAALIGLLAVDSDFQSRGVGKTLFAAAIEFAKSVGKCRRGMMFVINQRADIQAWYERLGFAWNGDRREFVFPDKALQDDIWFKVYEKEL